MEVDELKCLYVMLKCDVPQLHNEVQVRRTMLEEENWTDKMDFCVEILPFIGKNFPYLY